MKYDLKTGYPDLELVPRALMAKLASAVITEGRGLQYGGSLQGVLPIREALAAFLSPLMGQPIAPSQLMLTTAALHAIDIVCRTVAGAGDIVIVENPTFFFAVNLLRMSRATVVGVPMTASGIDLEAVARVVAQYGRRVKLVYTIPAYHNPTGINATAANRAGLAQLAAQHDFLVLEDATYQPLYYAETPPPPVKAFDLDGEHVVTVASVSKIVMPSLKVGWIWASPKRIASFTEFKSDGASSTLTAGIVVDLIQQGMMPSQVERARLMYKRKHDLLVDALSEHLPDWVVWKPAYGGYFIWATLPQGITASQVLARTEARGMSFMAGRESYVEPVDDQTMRLCFGYLPDDLIPPAAAILAECLREFGGDFSNG